MLKKCSPKIHFDIVIIDHNSKKEDLEQIKKQLNKTNIKKFHHFFKC